MIQILQSRPVGRKCSHASSPKPAPLTSYRAAWGALETAHCNWWEKKKIPFTNCSKSKCDMRINWLCLASKMQAELQVLTPLVPVREVSFLRFCKQHAEGVWAVVDVSVDGIRENLAASGDHMSCRRLPSGFLVQAMPSGYSKVSTPRSCLLFVFGHNCCNLLFMCWWSLFLSILY